MRAKPTHNWFANKSSFFIPECHQYSSDPALLERLLLTEVQKWPTQTILYSCSCSESDIQTRRALQSTAFISNSHISLSDQWTQEACCIKLSAGLSINCYIDLVLSDATIKDSDKALQVSLEGLQPSYELGNDMVSTIRHHLARWRHRIRVDAGPGWQLRTHGPEWL